jgi:hypothetical protein
VPTISLDIRVKDAAELTNVLALFNKIQVWRAPEELGQYTEITGPADSAAFADGSVVGPWNVQSESLIITRDGVLPPFSITFVGNNPLDLAHVLDRINSVMNGVGTASEVPTDTNKVRITSPLAGTGSSLLISGTAVPFFGFPTKKVNGRDARISLQVSVLDYTYIDLDGEPTYWYKTRFFSSINNSFSAFSTPQRGQPVLTVPSAQLVKASITLADAAGRPVVDRRIIFVPVMPLIVPTTTIGVLPGTDRIIAITDLNGHAEIPLVIGMTMKVFIEGAAFQREFVVPNTDFDVLAVATAQPDPLNIVVSPPIPIVVS